MARYFSYTDIDINLYDTYNIAQKITNSLLSLTKNKHLTQDELNIVCNASKKAIDNLEQINFLGNAYTIQSTILHDLLEPHVVNYLYNFKEYPKDASPMGEKVQYYIRSIFKLEDEVQPIVSKLWSRLSTPFEEITNGKPFTTIGHSTSFGLNLDVKTEHPYLSCSIFDTTCMNYYHSPVTVIFDITEENYISSASFDSATHVTNFKQSIFTLKTFDNGESIEAGYTYNNNEDKIIIKCENPDDVLNHIHSHDTRTRIINETILDKSKVKPQGILLFSDGLAYSLPYYLIAYTMHKKYNIPIKLIDRRKYETNEIGTVNPVTFQQNVQESHDFLFQNESLTTEEKLKIINSFQHDVLKQNPYPEMIMNLCQEELHNLEERLYHEATKKR